MVARSRILALVVVALVAGCTGTPIESPATSAVSGSPSPTPTGSPLVGPTPAPTPAPTKPSVPIGHIAFVRGPATGGPGVNTQVWIVDVASGLEQRITSDDTFKSSPVWLLDGSRLAYAWYRNPDPYHDTLTTILPDGSGRRDLGAVQTVYSAPAISPDGQTVAYGGDGTEDGSSGIVLLDLGAGTRRMLTRHGETSPIWSPDSGKLLACLPSRRVVVIDARTGGTLATISDPSSQLVYGWSADGSHIFYEGYGTTKQGGGAWTALADGSGAQPYGGPLPDTNPAWTSPDGQWRAEVRGSTDLPGIPGLFVAAAAGGAGTRISGDLVVGTASWSPDGAWLAFDGSTPAADPSAPPGSRIYVVSRTGGLPVPISTGPLDEAPAWQPAAG